MVLTVSSKHPFLDIPASNQTIKDLYKYPQIIQRSTLPDSDYSVVFIPIRYNGKYLTRTRNVTEFVWDSF